MIRILSIDDTPLNQKVLMAMLSRADTIIDCAESAAEGFRRLDEARYDIVLMDLRMPVMDGFEAIEVIRQRTDHHATIPIIVVTADAAPHLTAACLAVGGTGLITKPYSAARLCQMIAEAVMADADVAI